MRALRVNLIDDKELIRGNFNSNNNCKCLTISKYETGDSKYIFQYKINDPNTEKAFSNLIDENDSLLRKSYGIDSCIQPRF